MKILIYIPQLVFGGAEKVLAAIAQMVAATAAMVVGIVMVSNM